MSKATRDGIGQRLSVVRKEWAEVCITLDSPDMTALYRDVRGSEWIEIRQG